MPSSAAAVTGLTRDFDEILAKHAAGGTKRSQLHLVGFITARVTAEGSSNASPSPTPERLAQALHNIRKDLGGCFH